MCIQYRTKWRRSAPEFASVYLVEADGKRGVRASGLGGHWKLFGSQMSSGRWHFPLDISWPKKCKIRLLLFGWKLAGFRRILALRGNLVVFMRNSAIPPPKFNRFGWNLKHSEYIVCWGLAMADFGHDPTNSDSLSLFCFCLVNNARYPVERVLPNLNKTWGGEYFRNRILKIYRKLSFSEKMQIPQQIYRSCDFRPP